MDKRKAVFAAGSPFKPVQHGDRLLVPGQCNNVYIFPGIGLGVIASGARLVTDRMFFVAAEALAGCVEQDSLDRGTIYPPFEEIYSVSTTIAKAVMRVAYRDGLATVPEPADLDVHLASMKYEPEY